jgi:predicted nucleotidyltransferase
MNQRMESTHVNASKTTISQQETSKIGNSLVPEEILDRVIQQLVKGFQPEQIILFGSHVYGQPDRDSDLDLMVIVPDSDQPPHRRAQKAYAWVGAIGFAKDLIVLTEEEFERQAGVATSLAHLVKEQGRVVYERRETSPDPKLAAQE